MAVHVWRGVKGGGDPQERKPCSVAPPFQVKTATRITVTPGLKSFQRGDHSFRRSGSCWCCRFSPVLLSSPADMREAFGKSAALGADGVNRREESKVHGSQTSSHLARWNDGRRAKASHRFKLKSAHVSFWI